MAHRLLEELPERQVPKALVMLVSLLIEDERQAVLWQDVADALGATDWPPVGKADLDVLLDEAPDLSGWTPGTG